MASSRNWLMSVRIADDRDKPSRNQERVRNYEWQVVPVVVLSLTDEQVRYLSAWESGT